MSDENKVVEPQNQQEETATPETAEPTKAKEMVFTQEQLDNIIKSRLDAEQKKHQRMLDDMKKKEEDALKEKQIQETKSKQELEKLMQDRLAEKDQELNRYKTQIKKEKVDNSILSVASQNKAVSPQQVVALLKDEVKYNDDGRIEVVDNNSNVRYNPKGELLTIEERVKEFLEANPHFRQGSLSGQGSQSSIGGNTVKPLKIQDLDLSNPEDRKTYAEYRKKRDSGAIEINLNK